MKIFFLSRRTETNGTTLSDHLRYRVFDGTHVGDYSNRSSWLSDLRRETSGDVLLNVHGFNTSTKRMLESLAEIHRRSRSGSGSNAFKGAIVGYDWPAGSVQDGPKSDGLIKQLVDIYKHDRKMARRVAKIFVADAAALTGSSQFATHLLAHSMGAYVVLNAMTSSTGSSGKRFEQIILNAADVERRRLGKSLDGRALFKLTKRVTHYHCDQDQVLQVGGQIMHGGKSRSGREGLPMNAPDEIVSVDLRQRYNATGPKWPAPSHNWMLTDAKFLSDLLTAVRWPDWVDMPTRRRSGRGWALKP